MKTRSFIVILSGIFLIGSAGIAPAGGMKSAGEGKHREMAEASPPIMVPNDYLEYLEIERGLETGSLTAHGVEATTSREARPAEGRAEATPPVMVSKDYLEYLEIERGIETGSLTSPGVFPSEIRGPSERVEVPEGG